MAFQQTSAPTGWTKDTTAALNDSILRIVTGTAGSGGATAFSTFNGVTTTDAHTLTQAQTPSHYHVDGYGILHYPGRYSTTSTAISDTAFASSAYLGNTTVGNRTSTIGSSGSHTHGITSNIKYNDFIIASKD
tara:strand:+ start:235 stop:633 length:399 start_codon:yes stop_codon:yes gene_type:complete